MPAKIVYERFLWFHRQIKAENYPNARILADKFELSQKTAQRDIEFIRDRLNAPLQYIPDKRGYAYEEKTYHKDETTQRVILPLHLLQYMGSWHVISHCSLRNELRDFALSRIRSVKPSLEWMNPEFSSDSIKEYIRRNFGLLSRDRCIEVCLKFSPQIVPWVSEQIWHSEQKQAVQADGSLCLVFTVADLREVKREVLKYGSQVEVLLPVALRNEVREEIEKMAKIYRSGGFF